MNVLTMGVLVLLTAVAAPPVERVVTQDGWTVTERAVPHSAAQEAKLRYVDGPPEMPVEVDFECEKLGAMGSECWKADGVRLCVEAVNGERVIVDTGFYAFGDRSLRAEASCISDEPAHLLVLFTPPVKNFVVTIAQPVEGSMHIVCWLDADDVGDESAGYVWVPRDPDIEQLNVGFGHWAGMEACTLYGTVDLLGGK